MYFDGPAEHGPARQALYDVVDNVNFPTELFAFSKVSTCDGCTRQWFYLSMMSDGSNMITFN